MNIRQVRTIVVVDPGRCADCGATLELVVVDQPALLRHGGYGATVRTSTRRCSDPECDWQLEFERIEIRPVNRRGSLPRPSPLDLEDTMAGAQTHPEPEARQVL